MGLLCGEMLLLCGEKDAVLPGRADALFCSLVADDAKIHLGAQKADYSRAQFLQEHSLPNTYYSSNVPKVQGSASASPRSRQIPKDSSWICTISETEP
jgi:hypothetical protein